MRETMPGALKIALAAFAASPPGLRLDQATATVAEVLRDTDLNCVRANAFVAAQHAVSLDAVPAQVRFSIHAPALALPAALAIRESVPAKAAALASNDNAADISEWRPVMAMLDATASAKPFGNWMATRLVKLRGRIEREGCTPATLAAALALMDQERGRNERWRECSKAR